MGKWEARPQIGRVPTGRDSQVGRDPRLSGPALATALAAGLASRGAAVTDFGPATTPAMFMSCILEGESWGCSHEFAADE